MDYAAGDKVLMKKGIRYKILAEYSGQVGEVIRYKDGMAKLNLRFKHGLPVMLWVSEKYFDKIVRGDNIYTDHLTPGPEVDYNG